MVLSKLSLETGFCSDLISPPPRDKDLASVSPKPGGNVCRLSQRGPPSAPRCSPPELPHRLSESSVLVPQRMSDFRQSLLEIRFPSLCGGRGFDNHLAGGLHLPSLEASSFRAACLRTLHSQTSGQAEMGKALPDGTRCGLGASSLSPDSAFTFSEDPLQACSCFQPVAGTLTASNPLLGFTLWPVTGFFQSLIFQYIITFNPHANLIGNLISLIHILQMIGLRL